MKDTLFKVAIYNISGRQRDRVVQRRLLGGKFVEGKIVTLTTNRLPFTPQKYKVVGFDPDGTPRVAVA